MRLKVALSVTVGVLVSAMLAACSTAGAGDDGAASGGPTVDSAGFNQAMAKYLTVPTKLPVTTPLSKKPPSGIKVVFLQNGQTPGQSYSAALTEAAKVLDWSVQDINFDASNPAAVGSAFEAAVNESADVIMVQGLDAPLYAKFVPAAAKKGIVVVDTVTSGDKVPGVTYVDRSDAAGKAVAEITVAAILADAKARHVTPHVLNISSVLLRSILTPTNDAIAAGIKAADCGACTAEVFELSPEDTVSNTVVQPVVSYLQSHPDINYIFTSNGAFSTGLLSGIKQAGLGTSIRLIGATPLPPQIQELKAGSPQELGWIANSISVVAWMSMDAAARVLVGDDAEMYAELAAPTWLLTRDSGAALVPVPVAPVDYQQEFTTMWHES